MTSYSPISRRDGLKGIAIASILGGAAVIGVSIADRDRSGPSDGAQEAADDGHETGSNEGRQPRADDERAASDAAADGGGVRLVARCSEPSLDLAAFRVDNDTDEGVTVRWEADEVDDTGAVTGDGTESGQSGDAEPAITFPDCETVTVRGDFADVIPSVVWWDEDGLAGTISEPVGPVDGERTVNVDEHFGIDPAAGPVVTAADAFEPGSTVMPGGGDVSRRNPDARACEAAALAALEGAGADGGEGGGEDEGVNDGEEAVGTGGNESGEGQQGPANTSGTGNASGPSEARDDAVELPTDGEVTVRAGGSSYVFARAPAGATTVRLFHRGERIDAAESDPGARCRALGGEAFDDGTLPNDLDRADVLAALDERD